MGPTSVSTRLMRRFLALCLAFTALLFCLYALRVPILSGLAHWLIVDEELAQADVIVVLNGGLRCRPSHAAALYEAGYAPLLVIPRSEGNLEHKMGLYPNESDVAAEMLYAMDVPADAVEIVQMHVRVASTYDEALTVRDYVQQHGFERVIVVTSNFHTRRTRWIFSRVMRDTPVSIQVSSATDPDVAPSAWWRTERGLLLVFEEYLKTVYYHLRYR